jgi:hypothetical protein
MGAREERATNCRDVILTTETPEFIKEIHNGEEKGEGESG